MSIEWESNQQKTSTKEDQTRKIRTFTLHGRVREGSMNGDGIERGAHAADRSVAGQLSRNECLGRLAIFTGRAAAINE